MNHGGPRGGAPPPREAAAPEPVVEDPGGEAGGEHPAVEAPAPEAGREAAPEALGVKLGYRHSSLIPTVILRPLRWRFAALARLWLPDRPAARHWRPVATSGPKPAARSGAPTSSCATCTSASPRTATVCSPSPHGCSSSPSFPRRWR